VRERRHDAARDVAKNLRLAPDRLARQTTAHIAVNGMGNVGAGAKRHKAHSRNVNFRFAQIRSRVARRVAQLDRHDQLGQLLADVGFLVDVVAFGGQRRRAQNDVADGGLAAGVGMTMEQREEQRQNAAIEVLAGQEDPFPRYEAVVENQIRIGQPGRESAFEVLPLAVIVNGHHLLHAVVVRGHGKRHGVVLVLLAQRAGGNHQHFIGNGGFRDVQFAAFHNDTVLGPFFDAHVSARIWLFGRTQHTVALGVRLGAGGNHVFLLKAGQPLLEILVVVRLARLHLVRFKRYVVDGVGAVDAHAPLDAAADFLAEHAGHVLLAVQVGRVLVNVREAVDLLPGEVRRGRHQHFVLRLGRLIIRCAHHVDAVALQLVGPVDQLPVIVDVAFHFRQGVDKILLGSHREVLLSFICVV